MASLMFTIGEDQGMKSINPTPYIFKDTFDFKFDTFKSAVDEYIDEASQYDEETPEKHINCSYQ